jgi:hypothetical protein
MCASRRNFRVIITFSCRRRKKKHGKAVYKGKNREKQGGKSIRNRESAVLPETFFVQFSPIITLTEGEKECTIKMIG